MDRLYQRHGPALMLFARLYVADGAAAEDAVHRVFVKLLGGHYIVEGSAAAYLYRAVKNEALNDRRSRSREIATGEERAWFSSDGPAKSETAIELQRALSALPEEQRDVVVMRVWSGMTFEEVAEAMEVNIHTAASRYRYGLERLRERLTGGRKAEGQHR